MAIEKNIKINVDTSAAVKGVDNLNDSIKGTENATKDVSKSSKGLGDTLDKLTGGAVSKFKGMTAGLGGVSKGFKGVGIAIAASGLGILLITIGAIKTAFTNSEAGQNKFAKIMGVIGSVTGNLIDVLAGLGDLIIGVFEDPKKAVSDLANLIKNNLITRFEGLMSLIPSLGKAIKQLFEGDFIGASKTAADAVGKVALGMDSVTDSINNATRETAGFIAELEREAKVAGQIADDRAKADLIERDLITEKAQAERDIAELRDKSGRKDLFNAAQRKAFLIEASKINEDITNKEIAAAEIRKKAILAENELDGSTKENLNDAANASAKVIQLETKRLNLQKRLGTEISALNSQASAQSATRSKARESEIAKEVLAEEKRLEDIQKLQSKFNLENEDLSNKTHEDKLETLRTRAQEELDLLVGTETEKREAQISLNALFDAKEKELKEQRKAEDEQKIKEEQEQEFEKKLEEAANDELSFSEKRELLTQQRNDILADETLTEEQKTGMLAANSKARDEVDKKREAAIKKGAAAAASALTTASELLGKSTAAGKAAAVAATTIDTIQSGVSAFKGMTQAIPGPVGLAAGAVAAAGALVSGFASVKKILAVKTPGGGGGGAPSAPSAPSAPAFNLVGSTGVNQVQDSLEPSLEPMRAYVVGADVTSQQEVDNAQASSASIG